MNLRFYVDEVTGRPHILNHGVTEDEVAEVLECPHEDRFGREGSRIALGQTNEGRYLKVVYVPDRGRDSAFVITAYELGQAVLAALKRRLRKKQL